MTRRADYYIRALPSPLRCTSVQVPILNTYSLYPFQRTPYASMFSLRCEAYNCKVPDNEQWAAIHMMPEETIQASIDLKSKRMMPIHWSAFNLSLHTWTDPVERATKAAQKLNVNILTPRIGQRFSPSTLTKNQLWWRELE